jgi:hypothetical protein
VSNQPKENDLSNNNIESVQPYTVSVSLAANEVEVLEQLFIHGPTWDGNIVSKSGRDQLFDLKLAGRVEGYSFLLAAGIRLCLNNRVDRKKEANRRREREKLAKLDSIEFIVAPTNQAQQNGEPMGYASPERPTVEGLQELLRPERDDNAKSLR